MNPSPFRQVLAAIAATPALSRLLSALETETLLELEGPEGAARAMVTALAASRCGPPVLVVVPTDREALELAADLQSLGCRSEIFPWWGILPYHDAAPLQTVFGERTKILSALLERSAPIVIAPERAFLTPLPPPEYFGSLLIPLKKGEKFDSAAAAKILTSYGYVRTSRVQLHGEFALRGEVLDLFMGGEEFAHRVLLDWGRVESIRRFDPLDQAGVEKIESLTLRPLKEVVWTPERIAALENRLKKLPEFGGRVEIHAEARKKTEQLLEELKQHGTIPCEELFFPLAFPKAVSLLDYLGGGSVFYLDRERLENAQSALVQEYTGLYRRGKKIFPLPERILFCFADLAEYAAAPDSGFRNISFMGIHSGDLKKRFHIPCDPARSFFGNIEYLREEFGALLKQDWNIIIAAESEVQAERIGALLASPDGEGVQRESLVVAAPLSAGFALSEARIIVVQENEIFGRRRRPPRSLGRVRSSPIDTFIELNSGDFIVHINYGIGRFLGIERIRALGHERDYVKLEYLGDETVFVPIEQVNMVQRYIGSEGSPPRLDKLGSKSWENRKGRIKKSVEDIAEKLIGIYSKRKASPGFAFPADTEWQTMFEAAFPFEETEDQLRCVEEIKTDMESAHPMDRLVCGDVGYGKTEVAVRACFKAIMSGKQAAFLAPTTILSEQHFENFIERFKQFPVKLAMLSRFVTPRETKQTLAALKSGAVDILVGTHRIIQKDVVFRDLGLLVIDEEQRFGVKDKERLKEFKAGVDCLTLSATPIPRTLHMSLLKIRDMSLLATAPQNRHPIETIIGEFDEEKLARAVRSEVERGGQIFFLHNRIDTLDSTRVMLERIVPEMLIETAHGQMDGRELEDVMHRFVHGGFHILVSTTIIENGIDIPNVNTIVIDRADMYGVSQLYQLRGRVGRSDRVAYAYLFYPKNSSLSETAMRRLEVISDFTELGSGFKIAMKDMEIRGAGNLLGREQSGDIYSVGFDLYLRLLDEAVHRLENENYEAETETLLELEYSGFIPDVWIGGNQEKMEVYKKIAAVRTREELDSLHAELVDRFGSPPEEAASLLSLAEIRIICRSLSVSSLREREGVVQVEFAKVSKVNTDRLVRFIKEGGGRVRLDPKRPNILLLKTGSIGLKEKSEFIREKLAALAI
ncbi:MAG: transcription-repair coupling factor [Treponema sp.]|jgi:transcription-repair coupling factor (superfamily II helicase)|nr:transcription-repair coupling factor [Treponema sp.]